jgi:hypothetical protein
MIEPLLKLNATELMDLAEAIRTGRVSAPFTPISMRRHIGSMHTSLVAEALNALFERDGSSAIIADLLTASSN